jgi:hypothetical protein
MKMQRNISIKEIRNAGTEVIILYDPNFDTEDKHRFFKFCRPTHLAGSDGWAKDLCQWHDGLNLRTVMESMRDCPWCEDKRIT